MHHMSEKVRSTKVSINMGLSVELSLLSSSSEGDFGFKFVPEVRFQLSPISHPNFNSVSGTLTSSSVSPPDLERSVA